MILRLYAQAEVPDPKWICPDRSRWKMPMSSPSQTQSAYVQTVPDSKCLCPDRPRRKMYMSRLSCVQNFLCVLRAFEDKYVQTIPDRNSICPDFRAFLSRPSCAPTQIRAFNAKFLLRPCPKCRKKRIFAIACLGKKLVFHTEICDNSE